MIVAVPTLAAVTSTFSVLGMGFVTAIALIAAVGAQNAFLLRQALRGAVPVWPLVLCCALSEIGLIALGVLGAGAIMESAPWALEIITWVGVVFLVCYGFFAARRAVVGGAALDVPERHEGSASGRGVDIDVDIDVDPSAGDGDRPADGDLAPAGGAEVITAERTRVRAAAPVRAGARTAVGVRAFVRRPMVAALLGMLAFTWLNPHAYFDSVVVLGSVANGHGDLKWVFAAGCLLAGMTWYSLVGFGAQAFRGVFANPVAWRVLDGLIAAVMFAMAAMLALH